MIRPGLARASLAAHRRIAAAAALAALLATSFAQTQTPSTTPETPVKTPAVAPPSAHAASASRMSASASKSSGKARAGGPLWRELSAHQHQTLAPLASTWDTLSEAQKRKWLAMSANYPKMSAAEQEKLHSRMAEWVELSPQQRAVARLNYGETKKIAADDKKAKWEAYQALPAEEKRKLAAGVAKPPTTAAAVRPVSPEKLAIVPKPHARPDSKTPRIAVAPQQVDHNTLLPQQPSRQLDPHTLLPQQPSHQVDPHTLLPQQPSANGGPN